MLHIAAVVQISKPTKGQAFYRRKLAEGKSKQEALPALKRPLSDVVYRRLKIDARRHQEVRGRTSGNETRYRGELIGYRYWTWFRGHLG